MFISGRSEVPLLRGEGGTGVEDVLEKFKGDVCSCGMDLGWVEKKLVERRDLRG